MAPSPRSVRRRAGASLAAAALVAATVAAVSVGPAAAAIDADGPDYNGDGRADLVVAAPGEDIGGVTDVGAITVLYGTSGGLSTTGSRTFHQDSDGVPGVGEANDRWGTVIESGDFDGDGFDDVAVGAPSEDVGTVTDAGGVTVLYGSPTGLSATGAEAFNQSTSNVPGASERRDGWGSSLEHGDFDGDGRDDLAIGASREDVGSTGRDQGAVTILYGTTGGLATAGAVVLSQSSSGVPGAAETEDRWGSVLEHGDFDGDGRDDLAIGAPNEHISGEADTGALTVLYGSSGGLSTSGADSFHQGTPGVPGQNEDGDRWSATLQHGDFDGDGRDDLAIAAPGERIAPDDETGVVVVLYGTNGGLATGGSQTFHQDTGGIPGNNEDGDAYGSSMAAGDFDGDGRDDLVVGAPSEDIGNLANAGSLTVTEGGSNGLVLSGTRAFQQNTGSIPGSSEAFDRWAHGLAHGDFDDDGRSDLVVGSPFEVLGSSNDAGMVTVMEGRSSGLTTSGSIGIHQGTGAVPGSNEPGDLWGVLTD